jgi:hypothetical protein
VRDELKFEVVVWLKKTDTFAALRDQALDLAAEDPFESTVDRFVRQARSCSIATDELQRSRCVDHLQRRASCQTLMANGVRPLLMPDERDDDEDELADRVLLQTWREWRRSDP